MKKRTTRNPQKKSRQKARPVEESKGSLQALFERIRNDKRTRLVLLAVVLIGGSFGFRSCLLSMDSPSEQVKIQSATQTTIVAEPLKEESAEEKNVSPAPPAENKRPAIKSLTILPTPAFLGSQLKVKVEAVDEDGDDIQFQYRWSKNSQPIEGGIFDSLETKGFRKKDLLEVEVIPSDFNGEGKKEVASVVLNNRPPKIVSTPAMALLDGHYIYEVKAVDDDGDQLSHSLENSPPGMTIDSKTGRIDWVVPGDIQGFVSGMIVVSDGESRALQLLQLTFAQQPSR